MADIAFSSRMPQEIILMSNSAFECYSVRSDCHSFVSFQAIKVTKDTTASSQLRIVSSPTRRLP